MSYTIKTRILPNAQLPLKFVQNTFEKRNKMAELKSREFYNEVTNQCKDEVYSIPKIRKCIDKLFAPNKINYRIIPEDKKDFSGSIGLIVSTDKTKQILQYDGIALHLPLKNGNTEINNKYTLFHEIRHMIDYIYNPKVKMARISKLIGNEEYAKYTDYLKKYFMDFITIKTNMNQFKKHASDVIGILPRDVAIDSLQKIRGHLITEINAYKDEIHYRFKDIKSIKQLNDGFKLKIFYKKRFKFEEKLEFVNNKLKELIKAERELSKEKFG